MKYYKANTDKGSVVIQSYQALSVVTLESVLSSKGMSLEGYMEINKDSFEHKSQHMESIQILNEDDSMTEGGCLNE